MDVKVATIKKIEKIPGYHRLTCEAPEDILCQMETGGYIKVVLAQDKKRTFTIAKLTAPSSFVIDLVSHGAPSPTTSWLSTLKPEDQFQFLGPGKPSSLDYSCREFFLGGDYSALPAMCAHIKNIGPDKAIKIFFQGEMDVLQAYFSPGTNVEITTDDSDFLNQLASSSHENKALWFAGERDSCQKVKEFVTAKKLTLTHKYISSYWQVGLSDENHRPHKVKLK